MKPFVLSLCAAQALAGAALTSPAGAQAPDRKPQAGTAPSRQTAQAGQAVRSAVGGVLISPLLHRLVVKPGAREALAFRIENPGRVPHLAEVAIRPFTSEAWTYRTQFDRPHPRDAASWFEQKSQQLLLEPGQKLEFSTAFRCPKDADGPYWCMLQFTPRPQGSSTKSLVVYEIPIVLVAGKNPRPRLEVSTPLVEHAGAQRRGTVSIKVPVANPSDGFAVLGGSGTLVDASTGRTVQALTVEDRNLMPRTSRHLAFLVPSLPDGRYRVSFRVASGMRSLQPVTTEFAMRGGDVQSKAQAVTVSQSRLVLEPSSVSAAIPRGGSRTTAIRISNPTAQPIPVSLEVFGIQQAPNGAIGIGGPALPQGLAAAIEGPTGPLQPGESRTVRLRMTVPKEAQGDLWFALAATEAGPKPSLAETVTFSITVPATEQPAVALADPVVVKDGRTNVAIKYSVRNTGNVALRPLPSAVVLEDGVRLAERLAPSVIGDGGILPGASLSASVMLPPGLKPGSHIVEISCQYGDQDYARLRVPITVAAPPARKK